MDFLSSRNWMLRPFLFFLLLTIGRTSADDLYADKKGPLSKLREKYEDLPAPAKVGTTAVAGFVASRVALKTFVSAAKIAGAAFIT